MISMTQNIVPFSKEAENYILGSILIDETVANDVCGVLNENDFHLPENQKIYRVIKTLYLDRKGITIINIIEGLKSIGEYKDFTQSYLFELADSVPTVANVESYVTVIREKSIARDLFYKSQDISSKILKGEVPISDLLAETEKDVKVIAKQAMSYAMSKMNDVVILDTAGRLQIDEALMQEYNDLKDEEDAQCSVVEKDATDFKFLGNYSELI